MIKKHNVTIDEVEEVAKNIGISVTYYAGIERGEENPTYAVLEGICKVLRIKSSEILPY